MKRILLSVMAALLCATSHAQVNPKMENLFRQLTELDAAPRIEKSGGMGSRTRIDYRVYEYYSPDMYLGVDSLSLDSILREDRNKLKRQLAAIRHTLDELQEEAKESYHYEYHQGGCDTIVYSMNLCRDSSSYVKRYQTDSHPMFYSDEYLYFNFVPSEHEGGVSCFLYYTVLLPDTNQGMGKKSLESLTDDIIQLFRQNDIKPRKAQWSHDKAYSDSIMATKAPVFESMVSIGGQSLEGITHAQLFTVPREQEEKAHRLFDEISRMAQRFTEGNQDVKYRYQYLTFDESYWGAILTGYYDEATSCSINMRENESGFHFVIANTTGMEWFPVDWPSIKTFVNGKVSYFKGMKPKKD